MEKYRKNLASRANDVTTMYSYLEKRGIISLLRNIIVCFFGCTSEQMTFFFVAGRD